MRGYLNEELKKRQDSYTDTDTVSLFVGTWNLNGVKPYESIDISAWIFPIDESFIPDLVVVGLQEIVEVKASTLLGGGNVTATVKMWNEYVLRTLRTKGDYV